MHHFESERGSPMAKKTITETPVLEEVSKTIEETIQQSLSENCISLLTDIKNGKTDALNKDHIFEVKYDDLKDEYTLHVGSTEQDKGVIYLIKNLDVLPATIVGFSIMYDLANIETTISYIKNNQNECFVVLTPGFEKLV